MNTQGYLFITLGRRYIEECSFLVKTIKKFGDDRHISLLLYSEDVDFAKSFGLYDDFIEFDENIPLFKDCETNFEKFCLCPRMNLEKYLIYDETIITDTDMLCQCNTCNVWDYLSNQNIPIRMLGRNVDENWHWGCINEVSSAFGKKVPHVHGGFIYLRKSKFLNEFFEYCRKIFYLYDEYNCKRFFRGGKVDEIIFAITHSNFELSPIEFDSVPIMTFNYPEDIDLPSKLQTENGQNITLDQYIPFIHMFDKMEGVVFQILFDRLCKL